MNWEIIMAWAIAFFAILILGFISYRVMKHTEKTHHFSLVRERQRLSFPLRMQAYERLVIFLERINPIALSKRLLTNPNISARQHYLNMINTINAELEHNISQQIYVSSTAWEEVLSARDRVVALLNMALKSLPANAKAKDYHSMILKLYMESEEHPTKNAIEFLKEEARKLL